MVCGSVVSIVFMFLNNHVSVTKLTKIDVIEKW